MENANKAVRIDGLLFEKMVLGGASNLKAHVQEINDLNVFPIPDGDTGENMYLTYVGGVRAMQKQAQTELSAKARALADGMLLSARGNSGVILSQLFYGLSEGLDGKKEATMTEFASALSMGVKRGYGSVSKPVEGTILTVAREGAERALECTLECSDKNAGDFFEEFAKSTYQSLARTPRLLDVLSRAGVIDSGGAGLFYIVQGMQLAVSGESESWEDVALSTAGAGSVDLSSFNENSRMQFGYCTELLLQLLNSKCDPQSFETDELIGFLEGIGDSVVTFKTGTVVKIHVHTMTPYRVLEYCHRFGEFLTVKIENMAVQHSQSENKKSALDIKVEKKGERKRFAVVTVAMGQGLIDTFYEIGADVVIDGGQGNNPASERFIEAFDQANADVIFVLPNNKNIVMAAKQAAQIYTASRINVIESRNCAEGYSALSMLDYSSDDEEVISQLLKEGLEGVECAYLSRSVRDTHVDGVDIKKDEYIGFTDGKMLLSVADKQEAAFELLKRANAADRTFVIAVYGQSFTDGQKQLFGAHVALNYPGVEFYEIDGGQSVYDVILFME